MTETSAADIRPLVCPVTLRILAMSGDHVLDRALDSASRGLVTTLTLTPPDCVRPGLGPMWRGIAEARIAFGRRQRRNGVEGPVEVRDHVTADVSFERGVEYLDGAIHGTGRLPERLVAAIAAAAPGNTPGNTPANTPGPTLGQLVDHPLFAGLPARIDGQGRLAAPLAAIPFDGSIRAVVATIRARLAAAILADSGTRFGADTNTDPGPDSGPNSGPNSGPDVGAVSGSLAGIQAPSPRSES